MRPQSCRARFCNHLARVADDSDTAARNAAGCESSRIHCELRVQRRHVYFVPQRCCDVMSVVYRSDGAVMCQADGGLRGPATDGVLTSSQSAGTSASSGGIPGAEDTRRPRRETGCGPSARRCSYRGPLHNCAPVQRVAGRPRSSSSMAAAINGSLPSACPSGLTMTSGSSSHRGVPSMA